MAEEKKKLPKKTLNVNGFLNEFEKDDIKRKVDLSDLFQHFGVKLSRKGNSYKGLCPFHPDKNPSLSVSSEKGLFHCFGCEADGDHFDLVMRKQNTDFKGALAWLRDYAGLSPKAHPSNGKHSKPEQALPDNFIDPMLPEEPAKPETKLEKLPQPETQTEPEALIAEPDSVPPTNTASNSIQPDPVPDFQETKADLLKLAGYDSVTEVYHRNLKTDTQAQAYLQARGLLDWELVDRFKLGYSNNKLLELCSKSQIEDLKVYGFVNDYGKEHFKQCITFPIQNTHGQTISMYGRSIRPNAAVPHLYLKGGHKGVFNLKASKVYSQIVLTECIIDALSLIKLGVQNVQALYGANGFTAEHLQQLKDDRVKTIILALDNDEAGRKASESLKTKLLAEGFQVKVVEPLNTKDWNEALLLDFTDDQFRTLCDEAQTFEPVKPKQEFAAECDGLRWSFVIGGVSYILYGVREGFVQNLKVQLKAEADGKVFRDNVDLYAAKARANFAQAFCSRAAIEPAKAENDLDRILDYLETERDKKLALSNTTAETELTPEERQLGMEFLQNPRLMEQAVEDMEVLGYAGEESNKKLLYLCASSRKLDDPISVIILSESSAGKSYLVETVSKLIPQEETYAMTSVSDQGFTYLHENALVNKFLMLGEAVFNETVLHQLREMVSNKMLSRLVAVKDEKTGLMTSKLIQRKVIAAIVMTAASYDINAENLSRCFVINTDESREQTKKIHEVQKRKYSVERYLEKKNLIPKIIAKHYAAQRLLTRRVIVNPYSTKIAFPDSVMRSRRDHDRFMDLIACVCFLRQFQKTEKLMSDACPYIECDAADYRIAYEILRVTLPVSLTNFPKSAVNFYETLRSLITDKAKNLNLLPEETGITQREIREASQLSQMFVKRTLRLLCDYEYLRSTGNRDRGAKRMYFLLKDQDLWTLDMSMVPTPEAIEKLDNGKDSV